MSHRIKKWVDLFFDELPYSEEAAQARVKIEKALEETAPDAAPDELAARYGSYEKLSALAGCSEEEARAWRSTEALRDGDEVKKELRAQRWRAYLIAALFAGLPSQLLCKVFELQFCVDNLLVGNRVDRSAALANDVVVVEAAQNVDYGVGLADVG